MSLLVSFIGFVGFIDAISAPLADHKVSDLSPKPETDSVFMSANSNNDKEAPTHQGMVNGATPPVDSLRDAGAGKVRGPHGRFVNNGKSSSPVGRKGLKLKHVRKRMSVD